MSQKKLIIKYLESLNGGWVHAYDLRGKVTRDGFLGHAGDRRARELAHAGAIEHRIKDGYAEYRAKMDYEAIERLNNTPAFKEKAAEIPGRLF